MMGEVVFRRALEGDAGSIMEIIDFARQKMLAEGKQQWDEGYPLRSDIDADISGGDAYVLCIGGRVVAYGVIIFGEEPAYRHIVNGKWLSDQPYVVVHRLAVSGRERRRGLGRLFMQRVEQMMAERGVHSFKVDTNFDNEAMLHMLDKLSFSYCGEINYERGTRMAFEKVL